MDTMERSYKNEGDGFQADDLATKDILTLFS